jgi:hypothetical protein
MTPAQAYGHPNFVDDVPVQGPTDEGMRRKACLWTQTRIPQTPACVDCEGPIPMWTQIALANTRVNPSTLGGGSYALAAPPAYGLASGCGGTPCWAGLQGPSDPAVDPKFAADQLAWVQNTLLTLNDKIMSSSGSSCPTWADPTQHMAAAVGCFQAWWNTHYAQASGAAKTLRTDGALDEDSLCALITIVGMHPEDFPVPFPDPKKQFCQPATALAHVAKVHAGIVSYIEHLSTPAKVGLGVAVVAAVGGTVYAVSRRKKNRSR